MYRKLIIHIETDDEPSEILRKAKKVGKVVHFEAGPKIFERVIDGKTYRRTENENRSTEFEI